MVSLNDAQRDAEGRFPRDAAPDDLVVHQQDVQAVLNALWSAGAEGIQMQDQRIIATSAPRCVGNTLLLNGRTYSPPYVITAIGDVGAMQAALDAGAVGHAVQAVRGALRPGLHRGTRRRRSTSSGTPRHYACASPSRPVPWGTDEPPWRCGRTWRDGKSLVEYGTDALTPEIHALRDSARAGLQIADLAAKG